MTHVDDIEFLNQFRDDGDENITLLDPVLCWRLRRAYEDDEHLRDVLRIESAVRPKSEQEYLYAGYKAKKPGFNLAANPERVIGTSGGNTWFGSYHMQQPSGYGYAVDLTHHGKSTWSRIHKTLRAWGLHTTVQGEPWHHQAQTVKGVLPGPMPDDWPTDKEDILTPEMEERFDDLKTWVFNSTKMINEKLEELGKVVQEVKEELKK